MKHIIESVLIVGFGSIGRRHADIVRDNFPDIEIVILRHNKCDDNDTNTSNLFKCITSIDQAIALNPQAAIISCPATKHIAIAKKLAIHGVHLMIEKPISHSLQGVQELIDICYQNKLTLMIGHNLRFLPSLVEFKNQIASKKVGKIYSIRSEIGQYLPNWRLGSDYRKGVSAQKSLGGGVLLELSHEIDYLRWIFGEVNWVQSHISRQSDLDIDVDDSAHIVLGFKGCQYKEVVASLNMDFIRHDTTRRCYAIGEKGTLMWDAISGKVNFFAPSSSNWEDLFTSLPERNYTYKQEIKSFFESVEFGKNVVVSGEDGATVVEIIEAIEKSNQAESKVYL